MLLKNMSVVRTRNVESDGLNLRVEMDDVLVHQILFVELVCLVIGFVYR